MKYAQALITRDSRLDAAIGSAGGFGGGELGGSLGLADFGGLDVGFEARDCNSMCDM